MARIPSKKQQSSGGKRPSRPAPSRPKDRPKAASGPASGPETGSGPGLIRINKALAQAGVCSRRGADELVAAGRVTVNGEPAQAGTKVDPARDVVTVDGRPIEVERPDAVKHVYLILHKPIETVTTVSDPQGRPTVLDMLPKKYKDARVFPVGRLDFYSQGLLLLTTDGDLANRLMHPRWHLPKVYDLTVRGEVTDETLATMRKGMTLAEGERLAPVTVRTRPEGPGLWGLELTLMQGVNRQIRRMCRDLDLTVLRLSRTAQGPVRLGDLPPGQCRELSPAEVAALKKAVGLG